MILPEMEEIQTVGPRHLPLGEIQKCVQSCVSQTGPLYRDLGIPEAVRYKLALAMGPCHLLLQGLNQVLL